MKVSELIDLPPDTDAMSGLEAIAEKDPVVWTMLNRRVKGEAIVFDNSRNLTEESLETLRKMVIDSDYERELRGRLQRHRPWQRQPMRDQHKHKVYEKSRQVGVTEVSANEVFHFLAHHPGCKWIGTFPREKQLIDFSNTRVAAAFSDTPRMAALAGTPNQVFTRRVGNSYWLFRSAWESNLGEGEPADGVTLDEKDRMRDKIEFAFKEALKSSKWGFFREISTPTLPHQGIDLPFQKSDQMTWFVRCKKCGERQPIDHKENIVQIKAFPIGTQELPPESYDFLCRKQKCRGQLDRVYTGEWVPKYPDRKHIRGYAISQLMAAWISATQVMQDKIDMRFPEIWLNYVCFFKDTRITTRRGAKLIANIVTGDQVLSHDGCFHRVYETKHRVFTGTRIDVYIGRHKNPNLSVTEDHPLLTVQREAMRLSGGDPVWLPAGQLKTGDWLVYPRVQSAERETTIDFANYVDPSTVTITDASVTQFDKLTKRDRSNALTIQRFWHVDENAARFLGLFLAEGCVRTPTTVHHKDETDLIELSRSTFSKLGANVRLVDPGKYRSQHSRNALVVEAPSITLRHVFTKLFGGTSRKKRVPKLALDLPRAKRIAFLAGYFGGDGCLSNGNLDVRSCSPHIAYGIQTLLSSIGVPAIIKIRIAKLHGRTYKHYYIAITGSWREFFLNEMSQYLSDKITAKIDVNMLTATSIHSDTKRFYFRVGEVKHSKVKDQPVYNFEVDDTHSYVANGFVSHNCGVPAGSELEMLNDADFIKACAGHQLYTSRTSAWSHVTFGVDWGTLNWIVVLGRNKHNNRVYVLGIGVFEDTSEELGSARQVLSYAQQFSPDMGAADAGYGKDRNALLLRALCPNGDEGRFWVQFYNQSTKHSKTFVPEWSDNERARVTVDRTIQLKNVCRVIKEREVGLPNLELPEMELFRRHTKALVPFREIDDETKQVVEVIKSSGPDHLAHAFGSALLCMDKLSKTSRFSYSFE